MADLNKYFETNMDRSPSLERCPGTAHETEASLGTIVVCGGSNADRTADALAKMGHRVLKVIEPGWRAIKSKISRMTASLEALLKEEGGCCVVFQLLDNTVYMAETEDGSLIPARKELGGGYHIDGDLRLAPKELQYKMVTLMKPLFDAAGNNRKVLVAPIPRYLLEPCCADEEHMPNRRLPEFRQTLEDGLFDCRKHLRDTTFRMGLRNLRVIGPLRDLRRLGDGIWREGPVHMGEEGYHCIASLVITNLAELSAKRRAGVEAVNRPKRVK